MPALVCLTAAQCLVFGACVGQACVCVCGGLGVGGNKGRGCCARHGMESCEAFCQPGRQDCLQVFVAIQHVTSSGRGAAGAATSLYTWVWSACLLLVDVSPGSCCVGGGRRPFWRRRSVLLKQAVRLLYVAAALEGTLGPFEGLHPFL